MLLPRATSAQERDTTTARIPLYCLEAFGTYRFGTPTAIDRAVGVIDIFNSAGQGVSWNNEYGAGVALRMPTLLSDRFGFNLSGSYSIGAGEFKSNYFTDSIGIAGFRVLANYRLADLEADVSCKLTPAFSIASGFWGSVRATSDVREMLDRPDTSNRLARHVETSRIHFGVPLVLSASVPVYRALSFVPEIFARLDLGEYLRGFPQQSLSGGARLGLSLALDPPASEEPMPDPPISPIVAKPVEPVASAIEAAVHLTVEDRHVSTLVAERVDTVLRTYYVLPTHVNVTDSSVQDLWRFSDASTFQLDPQWDAVWFFRQIPNIVGAAMTGAEQSESLTIRAIDKIPSHSAFSVAEQLASYLQTGWHVAPKRIHVIKQAGEHSALMFEDGGGHLLAPVATERTKESFLLPQLRTSKYISSRSPVRTWKLSVTQGSDTLLHLTPESSSEQTASLLRVALGSSDTRIIATLHVTSVDGATATANDTLVVTSARSNVALHTVSITRFLFLDATQTSSWSDAAMDGIVRLMGAGTTTTCRSYFNEGRSASRLLANTMIDRIRRRSGAVGAFTLMDAPLLPASETNTPLNAVEVSIRGEE